MGYVNPGMLYRGNIDLFAHCLARLPSNAPIIEIGSFAGLSLNHLILFLRRAGRDNLVFSVDAWKFEVPDGGKTIEGSSITFDEYRAHVIETFRRNVTLFSGQRLPHHIELNSDQFFEAWAAAERLTDFFGNAAALGGPISFAYIDGDHSYEQSMRDFLNVDSHLERGGFIVFDDSADGTDWGAHQTAREAAALERYEVVAKNPHYCLRKVS